MWSEQYYQALENFLKPKKFETRRTYTAAIRQFFKTFGWISPNEITITHAKSFKETLLARGKKETTTLWRIAAMSSFMKFLLKRNLVTDNPFKKIDRNDINPEAYKVVHKYSVKDVLDVVRNESLDIRGMRNRAIRLFVLLTKCNREELSQLRIRDIKGDTVLLRRREQERTVELPVTVKEAIEEYWKAAGRKPVPEHGVFTVVIPSKRGFQKHFRKSEHDPIGAKSLRLILKRTSVRSLKKLPLPKIKPVQLPEIPAHYSVPETVPDQTSVKAYVRLEEIDNIL